MAEGDGFEAELVAAIGAVMEAEQGLTSLAPLQPVWPVYVPSLEEVRRIEQRVGAYGEVYWAASQRVEEARDQVRQLVSLISERLPEDVWIMIVGAPCPSIVHGELVVGWFGDDEAQGGCWQLMRWQGQGMPAKRPSEYGEDMAAQVVYRDG